MIGEVLSSIKGIEIYPVVSLILFFTFFIGMLIIVFRMKKPYREKMKNLPLEEGEVQINDGA